MEYREYTYTPRSVQPAPRRRRSRRRRRTWPILFFAVLFAAPAAVLLTLHMRVAAQKEGFAPYIPKEVPKLDGAVIETCGRYMIVCVSGSSEVGDIISECFGQEG